MRGDGLSRNSECEMETVVHGERQVSVDLNVDERLSRVSAVRACHETPAA